MLSLCSDVRQVGILKYLRCEDADYHMHRPVNCRASMGANFRWTTTELSRTRFRRPRCSPIRSYRGSIFPRAGRTALSRQYSMPSHSPTTPSYTRMPGPLIASMHGGDSQPRTIGSTIGSYSRTQARTWSGPGMPPACTTLSSTTTPGVDMTP